MRSGLILVLVLGCGHGGERGAARRGDVATASDAAVVDAAAIDASVLAVRWRSDVVVPVAALAERRFVPLAGWLVPVDGAAAVAPTSHAPPTMIAATPNSSLQPRVVAGDTLPASWRAAVGTRVAAYDRAGARCASTISGVFWLGLENGEMELGEAPLVVGELATAPGCDPVLVTDRPEPRFAAPTKANPTQRAGVTRAFDALPAAKALRRAGKQRDDVELGLFVGVDGAWMVAAAVYEVPDATCDSEPEVVRALFAVPASGAPTLVDGELGGEIGLRAVTVFDSDRDGHLELITGHGRFDHGMNLATSFVSYVDLAPGDAPPDGPIADLEFSTYFGCD